MAEVRTFERVRLRNTVHKPRKPLRAPLRATHVREGNLKHTLARLYNECQEWNARGLSLTEIANIRPSEYIKIESQASSKPQNKTQEEFTLQTKAHDKRYEMSGQRINFFTSLIPALLRSGNGAYVLEGVEQWNRPQKAIELWEYQASPYCRKVREACTLLDVDVLFHPCPRGGETHRPEAKEVSPTGKLQFPLMRDPNTGTILQESDDIVKYLFDKYGNGKIPTSLKLGPLTTGTAVVGSLVRGLRGGTASPNKQPAKPLDIWGYEASPFCLQVREVGMKTIDVWFSNALVHIVSYHLLTELEITHVYHNAARNSPKRPDFEAKWGVMQFPYIEDVNTKIAMYETPEILVYLKETYGIES